MKGTRTQPARRGHEISISSRSDPVRAVISAAISAIYLDNLPEKRRHRRLVERKEPGEEDV